ncbi:MAG: 30S ribosomal protein S5 [Spirochaetes bacterium]|nr:30S ribosomal protein S5 [Spirochaetota bacterium]
MAEMMNDFENEVNYQERIIKLSRVAKVVKGGRRFSFSALVTVGDQNGNVGIGFGKANEVTDAISKASQNAKKNLQKIFLTRKKTVPHEIIGRFKGSKVIIRPATPGTGIIAGGAVRSIMEVAGFNDVLAKVVGSKNQLNVTKATMNGLLAIRNIKNVASRRGKKMTDLF